MRISLTLTFVLTFVSTQTTQTTQTPTPSPSPTTLPKGAGKCYKFNRPPKPTPTPTPTPNTNTNSVVDADEPYAFKGKQYGIGSWFVSHAASDSTNGNSWCGYPYNDHSNGFAPDLSQMMLKGVSYEAATKMFCGLEAIVTDPSTKVTKIMYIIDAFDPKWVRSPGSIDIMKHAWSELHKRPATDKNVVIYNTTWELTGKRSNQYCFKCRGN